MKRRCKANRGRRADESRDLVRKEREIDLEDKEILRREKQYDAEVKKKADADRYAVEQAAEADKAKRLRRSRCGSIPN